MNDLLLDQADALFEALRERKAGRRGFTPTTARLERAYAAAERRYYRRLAAVRADFDASLGIDPADDEDA